jgi:hypothetical protein
MNWKGCGRKRSWDNFETIAWHVPAGTKENHGNIFLIEVLTAVTLFRNVTPFSPVEFGDASERRTVSIFRNEE